ncbi:MAG: 23S rRNA (uracil(1939)-C(5))-methyltransferase RlmD [Bacillus subtilis]|nr:23S rRNA (uracil(1939)-C(5))-methyltransferase RlmD [Bacillus subtilis]
MDTNWIHIGDKYKIEIRRQGINGEGIGYQNQLAIFVDGAIAQEIVEVEITAVQPNFAAAKILTIEKASPKRVDPPCPFYIRCGGCQMQHIDYVEQQKIKQSILKQALKRYTTLDVDRLPLEKTIGMKPGYGYRNKSQMPFRNTPVGLALGLFQPGSNKFVPIDDCIVQDPVVNRVNQSVLEILKKHQMEAADGAHQDGNLLHLVTRHLASTGQVQVTIVATRPSHSFKAIASQIARQNHVGESRFICPSTRKAASRFSAGRRSCFSANRSFKNNSTDSPFPCLRKPSIN